MLILFLMYSILCSEALLQRCLFFLQPVAGLTNRVPVRDSRAGAPLPLSARFGNFIMYGHFPSHFLLFYYSFIAQMVCGAFHSTTNIFFISRAIMLCFIYSFSFVLLYTCSLTISRHKRNMLAYFCIYTWYFSQCSLSCLLHKQLR